MIPISSVLCHFLYFCIALSASYIHHPVQQHSFWSSHSSLSFHSSFNAVFRGEFTPSDISSSFVYTALILSVFSVCLHQAQHLSCFWSFQLIFAISSPNSHFRCLQAAYFCLSNNPSSQIYTVLHSVHGFHIPIFGSGLNFPLRNFPLLQNASFPFAISSFDLSTAFAVTCYPTSQIAELMDCNTDDMLSNSFP